MSPTVELSKDDLSFTQANAIDVSRENERHTVWVPALLLLALFSRLVAAWSCDTICSDGAYFIRAARFLGEGDRSLMLAYQGFNIYPALLVVFNKLGLEFEFAAKLWGVLIGALTLLPLWGAFSRSFGVRVATPACFLFAVHPGLIQWASEPIRDCTYWFFFSFALYCLARVRETAAFRWFAMTGVTTTLAIYTRSEGWLLEIPLVFAGAELFFRRQQGRKGILGAALFAVSVPFGVLMLQYVFDSAGSNTARLETLSAVVKWVTSKDARRNSATPVGEVDPLGDEDSVTTASSNPRDISAPSPQSLRKRLSGYSKRLVRAYSPAIGLLTLFGILFEWRRFLRAEQLALLIMNCVLMSLIWAYLSLHADMNTRYFFPVVICCLPFAALGLIRACAVVQQRFGVSAWSPRTVHCAFFVLFVIGIATALMPDHSARRQEAAIGRWLKDHCGEDAIVAEFGGESYLYLTAHYARTREIVHLAMSDLAQIEYHQPDAIILRGSVDQRSKCARYLEGKPELGFMAADMSAILGSEYDFELFVRREASAGKTRWDGESLTVGHGSSKGLLTR